MCVSCNRVRCIPATAGLYRQLGSTPGTAITTSLGAVLSPASPVPQLPINHALLIDHVPYAGSKVTEAMSGASIRQLIMALPQVSQQGHAHTKLSYKHCLVLIVAYAPYRASVGKLIIALPQVG